MSVTPLTDYIQMRLGSPHKLEDECNFLLYIIDQVEREYHTIGKGKGCSISFNRKAVDLRMSLHQAMCTLPTILSREPLTKHNMVIAQSIWIFMDITANEALKAPWVIANGLLDLLQGLTKQIAGTMVLYFSDDHERSDHPDASGLLVECLKRTERKMDLLQQKCASHTAVSGIEESLEYFKAKQARKETELKTKGIQTVEELEKWLNKDN